MPVLHKLYSNGSVNCQLLTTIYLGYAYLVMYTVIHVHRYVIITVVTICLTLHFEKYNCVKLDQF